MESRDWSSDVCSSDLFERYGEDCAINEGGTLTDAGYIRPTGDSWNRYFDGTFEDIPDEYRVTGSGEELEQPSTITVLVVEPDKKPYVKEIPSSLESLQQYYAWGNRGKGEMTVWMPLAR